MGFRPLAIVGPTAVGKTDLSIEVAARLECEIISMDSRQVYRGMDIGTAKVGKEARARVPHHGLDLVAPGEAYSAGRFARDARGWIEDIRRRGRVPLLVGGTGFFLRALTHPVFREPPLDPERRRRLRGWLASRPADELARWAEALDPDRAEMAAAGGRQRLSRTIEIPVLTGRPLTWWQRSAEPDAEALDVRVVLLSRPRDALYRRIDDRARDMFRDGLVDEVRGLLDAGHSRSDPGMTATGYREVADFLAGEITLDQALDLIQRRTRAYARRQHTWFRHQLPEPPLALDAGEPTAKLVEEIARWWGRTGPHPRG
jgi:tRNA dimethylallyltransferase